MCTFRGNKGFTLIEVLMVVVILGLIAGIVIPKIVETKSDAETETCRSNLANLAAALERYKFDDSGSLYPLTAAGLDALVTGGYVDEVVACPADGTAYTYTSADGSTYTLTCGNGHTK